MENLRIATHRHILEGGSTCHLCSFARIEIIDKIYLLENLDFTQINKT
jgi:hypothetical protein